MASADEAEVEIARRHAERMYAEDEASRALGITLLDIRPGQATVRMRVLPSMVNGHRIVHGGYLFLLADTAFAFACNTYGPTTVARNCEIAFVRPVVAGVELTAAATERLRNARNGIYDVTVFGGDGQVVAEMRGHSRTLAPDRGDEGSA
jgi:acyl-CoA thioesterase